MKTGTSNIELRALRVALLAGVSVAALFAAGSVNAQGVVNPPFVIGDTYGVGKAPKGVDLSQLSIPGLGAISTTPGVLETNNAASTPVAQTTTGVLNSDGTPVKPTYATEITGGASSVAGTGNNAGSVLVNSQTGVLIAAGTAPVGLDTGATAPAGYAWKTTTTQDPTAAPLYRWVEATYAHDKAITSTAATTHAIAGTPTAYLVDANNQPVTGTQIDAAIAALNGGAGPTPAQQAAINLAMNTNIEALNAELKALGISYHAVSSTAVDANLTSATYYNFKAAVTSPQGQGNGTVAVNQGATASTTTLAGGVVLANNKGQYQASGPGGTTIYDPNAPVTGSTTGQTVAATTTVTAGVAQLSSSQGSITLDATVDPTLVVTNGTAAGTTVIHNGDVFAGSSVNAPVVNSITANTVNENISGSLNVSHGATVNLGNNVVHGIADPLVGTDAANKQYVDRGLNKAYQGTAIALALSQPIFAPGQNWAIRAGWGGYEGENAGGVSVAGIVGRDWFGGGSTVAIDGGIGFSDSVVAGKAGVTVGFGTGFVPLK